MKKFVFERYSDKGGIGETIIFDTFEKSKKHAESEWNHMTDKERDLADTFMIYAIEITAEELEAYNDGELEETLYNGYWSADLMDKKDFE